jgi:hypothetical protein
MIYKKLTWKNNEKYTYSYTYSVVRASIFIQITCYKTNQSIVFGLGQIISIEPLFI